jgi:hypothetical protein
MRSAFVLVLAVSELGLDPAGAVLADDAVRHRNGQVSSSALDDLRQRWTDEKARLAAARGVEDILLEGQSDEYGAAEPFSLQVDLAGPFRLTTTGIFAATTAYDGNVCWRVDAAGIRRTLTYSDRALTRLLAALETGTWLEMFDPASAALTPGPQEDQATLTLDVEGLTAQVVVSTATGLPVRVDYQGVEGPTTWHLAEYNDAWGWGVPGKFIIETPQRKTTRQTLAVKRVAPAGPEFFAPPPARVPQDVVFDAAVPAALKITRAKLGHVLVECRLDGGEPVWFIFDTGAGGTMIDAALADRLGLAQEGELEAVTVYGNSRVAAVRGGLLQVGPVTLQRPLLLATDMQFLRELVDERVMGIVGYELLSRVVCEIELATDEIRLYDPAQFPRDGLNWQPLTFHQNVPLLPARFASGSAAHDGVFRLDVGAGGDPASNAIFHTPTVEKYQFPYDPANIINEPMKLAAAQIPWFEIAGHRFVEPFVLLAFDATGPLADPFIDGNVGVEFLKPLRIVLDYQREQMSLEVRE